MEDGLVASSVVVTCSMSGNVVQFQAKAPRDGVVNQDAAAPELF